jgi:hypothetical protein
MAISPRTPEIRLDPDETRAAPPAGSRWGAVAAGVVLGLAGVAGWLWWSQQAPPPVARAPAPAVAPIAQEPVPDGAIQYPLAAEPGTDTLPQADIPGAVAQLLGPGGAAYVQPDDLPRRFAATVDNLARAHAPPLLWPVLPAPGRFTVETLPDGSQVIAAANAARYAGFVDFAVGIDSARAVQLYARMYPLLQQAYRELGFGQRYLNDRVVAVIDHLLAAPEPARSPRVRLLEVKGPMASTRPWLHYEFVDPELEALSAGQKMLVRMGLAHERRLKSKLRELRGELVRPAAQAPAR